MKLDLLDFKELESFPSGSGIEFFNGKIYLIGDDATDILVTNKRWKKQNEIKLSGNPEKNSFEKPKADLEAVAMLELEKENYLMVMYSGAKEPQKKGILVDVKNDVINEFDYSIFYDRLKSSGISDLNIEGAVQVHEFLIFCNRVNKTNPVNQLIITEPDFFRRPAEAKIDLLDVDLSAYDGTIAISGLTYSYENDQLLFTTSMEDGLKEDANGIAAKSYLGIVENGYRKIWRHKMKVNELIDLPATHKEFKGRKVESVCIQSEKTRSIKLHMIGDNDKGESFLYKVRLRF
ncbi:MAG: hypothetical protein JWM28_374 [Chitinophagaceae bacterium]|nr:hypothetical protein [Chitinophagaceae bacterium]